MAARRARAATLWIGLASAAVVAGAIYAARDIALEYWLIHKLEKSDEPGKADAAERLGELRSVRAVPALVTAMRGMVVRTSVTRALGRIFPAAGPDVQKDVVEGLLDSFQLGNDGAARLIKELSLESPIALHVLAEASEGTGDRARSLVSLVLTHAWPRSREYITAFFESTDLEEKIAFYESIFPSRRRSSHRLPLEPPSRETTAEIATYFARKHRDPKVRALSLSFTVFLEPPENADRFEMLYDLDLLREVFVADADPLVRRAVLRIAGFLSHREGNIDLKEVVLKESDPGLIVEAIQARDLWSRRNQGYRAFYLFDGLPCTWIPDFSGPVVMPWSGEEIARLDSLLATQKDSRVRDAASMAIAGRYSAVLETREDQLKVHEWGVWQDTDEILKPVQSLLAGLPAFVHRSEVTAESLWSARSFEPRPAWKPVIFFYTPQPMTVFIQVGFRGGRPWAYYPEVTDYTEEETVLPFKAAGVTSKPSLAPFTDGPGVSPPWLQKPAKPVQPAQRVETPHLTVEGRSSPVLVMAGDLERSFSIAPWIIPNHPSRSTNGRLGTVHLAGLGLEWCGLRIGYDAELEGEMEPVEPDSWWSYLRDVPCSTVALRGNHEKFLFYDGSIHVPSRLKVEWDGAERAKLVLTATDKVPGALVIRKRSGEEPAGRFIGEVAPDAGAVIVPLDGLKLRGAAIFDSLGKALEAAGLTHPETVALLRTWEPEFLRADGVRVISILPREAYDFGLPLTIYPAPGELVRVGLVWKELATK